MLSKQKANAKKIKGAIKQIYLLSTLEVSSLSSNAPIANCKDQDQSILWKLYMKYRKSLPRNVMLLLDHGGSLSKQQFRIVKAVCKKPFKQNILLSNFNIPVLAKQMISVLNEYDRIGVLAVSDEWSSPYLTDQCLMPNQIPPISDSHTMSPATEHNKYLLNKFVDSLTKGNGKVQFCVMETNMVINLHFRCY